MRSLHVVIPDFAPAGWRWIEPPNADRSWQWCFYRSGKEACAPAVHASRKDSSAILVSHGYKDAGTCAAIRARRPFRRRPFIAFSFHTPFEFGRRNRLVFRPLAPLIDRWVVHCEFERDYYANELKVPIAKIESVPWYFEEAEVASTPHIDGPYLCAVGASMRDYGTLFEAMRQLPELRLAAVVRPENLVGLQVPANVMVFKEIPKAQLWNIQYHSVMHVLPLARSARTGHACLTQAMYFARPNLVADVPCVADYVSAGRTAEMYRPGDVDDLAGAIQRLWYDDSARARLGDAARAHALKHFSQRAMGDFLEDLVQRLSPI